jgi:hypothetical protein
MFMLRPPGAQQRAGRPRRSRHSAGPETAPTEPLLDPSSIYRRALLYAAAVGLP